MRVAAAQTAPVWGDPQATADVVVEWVRKAAADDVDLLAFGETFLSGYPFWISRTDEAQMREVVLDFGPAEGQSAE